MIREFEKKGFIIKKNLFNPKDFQYLKKSLKNYLDYHKISSKKNFDFDRELLKLRKNKTKFGIFFDSFQTLAIANNFLLDKKILKIISNILKTSFENITFTDFSFRFDPPYDNRNSLGWHQDSSYFRQNSNGRNGVVIWAPITNLTKDMGPLEILSGSDKIGTLNVKKKNIKKKNYSSKREILKKDLKNLKRIFNYELKVGDAILMNLNMVHRSGVNFSNKFRISLQGRFHKMLSKDFNPGLNKYVYTNKDLNKKVHG